MTAVRFERRRAGDGLGVGTGSPRVSWITETDSPGWQQVAYEISVDDSNPGRIDSDASVFVPWPGPPLHSRQSRQVRVRVWGSDGSASAWSEAAEVEAGLLEPTDWSARFISPYSDMDVANEHDEPPTTSPSLLRCPFTVAGAVERARLYVTALGVYEIELNGHVVGDQVLSPGWTSYAHRLRVEVFDVTDLVLPDANVLGAWLAEGWYGGRLGWSGGRRVYGHRLALLAQLEMTLADGSTQTIISDSPGAWRSHPAPIAASSIYGGETYDARLAQPGWSAPGFNDSAWQTVATVERDVDSLVARSGPPVRRTEELSPVIVTTSPSGKIIVDFGQNLVGRLRIRVSGEAGTSVVLRHAEVLEDGELCTEPLRLAEATDRYTLRGVGVETWEPRFTFHGFRYAEVSGWPSASLMPEAVTAVVCHSDMERTGWFECSDERINQLHSNVVWSMRGNFLDVPTDCPQRDERLGWTGDINVFSPTASFLYDCDGFLASWLADLAAEQGADGAIPLVVPDVLGGPTLSTAVWGDAAVVVPWVLYQRFGDVDVLRDQYASMRSWVDHVLGRAGESRLWDSGFQFADWLDPAAPEDRPQEGRTDPHLLATASLCHSLDLLGRTAEVISELADATHYHGLAAEVREAFAAEYATPSGLLVSDSQAAYALALRYALLPRADQRARAGQRLAKLVRRAGYRIATGFVGAPIVCDALCEAGEPAKAYELFTQTECPSWLYPVLHGATTIWERWDAIRPDDSLNGTRMNSFNHYAFGAIADWMHRTVGGLGPVAPGYRKIRIAPRPGGGLSWASSRLRTPYGVAESAWHIHGDEIEVSALIPPNTTAEVVLPGGADEERVEVAAGRHLWRIPLSSAGGDGSESTGGFSLAENVEVP